MRMYADNKKEQARIETVLAIIKYLEEIGYLTAAKKVAEKFK